MQVHACLLALHTGRPVKMVYGREESFFGHVHRHPARMRYEHHATRDGRLVCGARADRCSTAAPTRRARRPCARTRRRSRPARTTCPNALIDAYVVYTDNPPCGAMRGFGAVQTCFAHEAQMDKLAAALEHGPGRAAAAQRDVDRLGRCRPARRCAAPRRSRELLERVRDMPDVPPRADGGDLPGGVASVTRGEGVVRGVGYAVGFKNVGYSEGFDDYSTARVRLSLAADGEPLAEVHTRGGGGRPGARHRAGADRPHRAGRRARRRAAGRHAGRLRRLLVGLAPDR